MLDNKRNAEYELKDALGVYSRSICHPNLPTAYQEDRLLKAIDKYIQESIKVYALEVIVATKTENEK
jgi:hypothetical protein